MPKQLLTLILLTIAILVVAFRDNCYAETTRQSGINKDEAKRIAQNDAANVYRDLGVYVILIRETNKKWIIDFELKDRTSKGGGPQYVISKKTGKILKKKYWQ